MFETGMYQQGRGLSTGLRAAAEYNAISDQFNSNKSMKDAAAQIQGGANREQVIQGLMAKDPAAAQKLMDLLSGGQKLQQNDQNLDAGQQELTALTQKVGIQTMQQAAMPLFGAVMTDNEDAQNKLISEAASYFEKQSPETASLIKSMSTLGGEQKINALAGTVKMLRSAGVFPEDPSQMQQSQPADVAKFEYWKSMNPNATQQEQQQMYNNIIDPYSRAFATGQGAGAAKVGTEQSLNPILAAREAAKTQAVEGTQTGQAELAAKQQGVASGAAAAAAEDERKSKAKGITTEALALAKDLASSDKLGSVTGINSMTPTLNPESQDIINKASQLLAMLTAENLKLMTGVLSETDIKMLRDLSSGLNVSEKGIKGSEQAIRARLNDVATKLEAALGGTKQQAGSTGSVVDWGSM